MYIFISESNCPNPQAYQPTTLMEAETHFGGAAVYMCTTGYQFTDGSTVRAAECLTGQSWSTEIPPCKGWLYLFELMDNVVTKW